MQDKIVMNVPVHYINEEDSVGVKAAGVVSKLVTEIEIRTLPVDLPEFIEVDIADLDIGGSVHMSDIKLPKGVEFLHPVDDEHDQAIVSIHAAKVEEEASAEEAEGAAEASDGEEAKPEADSDAEQE